MSTDHPRGPAKQNISTCRRGQGLTELTLALPTLLLLGLGLIEVSRAIETNHIMSNLTREGANVASRGGSLDAAVALTRANQAAVGLGTSGGVIASRIVVTGGVPRVAHQVVSAGLSAASRVGMPDSVAVAYQSAGLSEGESYYVVELFLSYVPVTGFNRFLVGLIPETMYDRSLF
jgi:Flp pilus assembly protein TadG